MLTREDNELLCRVGPGTPMGSLMREYWIPGIIASELPAPDGPPLRLMLLDEELLAFRTTSGAIGVIQNACPHRGASLFFGRNEEEGLRCVYHGWKFDLTGACTDMPNEPAESNFKHKIRATAYPCIERGGLGWVYMGPRATPPPLPDLEPNMLPDGDWTIQVYQRECNYMQALEGDIDTSHLGFLHIGEVRPDEATPNTFGYFSVADRAPRYEVVDTDFGTMYTAYRPAYEGHVYHRIANFLMPFYAMTPTGVLGMEVRVRAWVPLDDSHTLALSFGARGRQQGSTARQKLGPTEVLPAGTGWHDRFRTKANARNDFLLDRELQKADSYTGIGSIYLQDQAVTESMGAIYNRTNERLGTSDMMIIRTRKRLIDTAKAFRDHRILPETVENPALYGVRSGGVVLPEGVDWVEATRDLRPAFVQHPGLSRDIIGNVAGV